MAAEADVRMQEVDPPPEVDGSKQEVDPPSECDALCQRQDAVFSNSALSSEVERFERMEADPGSIAVLAVAQDEQVEDDSGNTAVTQKEWMSATVATLDQTKDRAKRVLEALRGLEQKEAERLEAQLVERRRQELIAEAVEKRRKAAAEAARCKRQREKQAEELRHQQEALGRSKKAESAALKAATANFKQQRQAEDDAKEKERVMLDLNVTSQKVLSGVLECQHTISKLWGVMMLCEKRHKLREGRPLAELFKDSVDQALQQEWQTLTTSRVELNVLATRGEVIRSRLEMLHVQLNSEQSRDNAMHTLMKSNSLPVLASGQQPQATSHKDVIKRALLLIEDAAELPRQSFEAVSKANSQCDLATAEVHSTLDRRKAEVGELIGGLQDQKADAEKTIGDAEKRIVKLRRRALNSTGADDQLSSAELLLADLKSLKQGLEADLRNKCCALKIDESCRQLTKVKSGGHVTKGCQTKSSMRKTAMEGPFVRKTVRDGSFSQLPAKAA